MSVEKKAIMTFIKQNSEDFDKLDKFREFYSNIFCKSVKEVYNDLGYIKLKDESCALLEEIQSKAFSYGAMKVALGISYTLDSIKSSKSLKNAIVKTHDADEDFDNLLLNNDNDSFIDVYKKLIKSASPDNEKYVQDYMLKLGIDAESVENINFIKSELKLTPSLMIEKAKELGYLSKAGMMKYSLQYGSSEDQSLVYEAIKDISPMELLEVSIYDDDINIFYAAFESSAFKKYLDDNKEEILESINEFDSQKLFSFMFEKYGDDFTDAFYRKLTASEMFAEMVSSGYEPDSESESEIESSEASDSESVHEVQIGYSCDFYTKSRTSSFNDSALGEFDSGSDDIESDLFNCAKKASSSFKSLNDYSDNVLPCYDSARDLGVGVAGNVEFIESH